MAGTERGAAIDRRRGWGLVVRSATEGRLRGQLVGVVLATLVLHALVVATALGGMREIEAAHADVEAIDTAQRQFQDADMTHDAIRAEALIVVDALEHPEEWRGAPGAGTVELHAAVDDFVADLRAVHRSPLPHGLLAQVEALSPLTDGYAADARALGELADAALDGTAPADGVPGAAGPADLAIVRAALVDVIAGHARLVVQLGEVTEAMSVEAAERRGAAADGEREERLRILLAATAAVMGVIGLVVLLDRLGARLARALDRERGVAEALQHSLLPDTLPALAGVRLAARYRAGAVGTQVGGDWYDVITLPGGRVGLVIGDVVGHDLRAASAMGQLRNALRACAADGDEPEDVLTRLNRLCVSQQLGDMATVLYAVLDPVAGEVRLASAGHLPPLLVSVGSSRWLTVPAGPPVGAVREPLYVPASHELSGGGVLLMFTDGLVERRGEGVDSGLARLEALVSRVVGEDGRGDEEWLERLCDHVLSASATGGSTEDDIALLAVAPEAVLGPRLDVVWPARAETLTTMRHLLGRWLTEAGADEDERYDLVVACSEAATNAIEHAYGPSTADLGLRCDREDDAVVVVVRDWGRWRAPRGQDRGRGTALMEGLVDELGVVHGAQGTEVTLRRRLRNPVPLESPPTRELVRS